MAISTKGPSGSEVIELDDGQSAAVSSATSVRIRANQLTGDAEVSAFGGAYQAFPGFSGSFTGDSIWVDSVYGNDATGAADRQDLPFLTVGAALAIATAGDIVEVRPGTYTEDGLLVPSGVLLRGSGWTVTDIGDNAGTADIITMGADSAIEGITIKVPAGAFAGLVHNAGTGSVVAINIEGTGGAGLGVGIFKTGTGKLIGGNIRCELGGLNSYQLVDSGVLALDDVHLPGSAGAIASMISIQDNGIYQCQGFNIGNPNCVDAIVLGGVGTPTARIYSPNIFNCTNAVHLTSDGPSMTLIGGRIGNVTLSVLVDPLLTGIGSIVRILGTILQPLFSFPPAAAGNTDFVLQFNQEADLLFDPAQRLIGGNLSLGFPELGSSMTVGKGEFYSQGIRVITSDSTATSTTLGGNLTDVTTAAQSRNSSTFSYQGTAANHCIYVCSERLDPASNPLKHWGHRFSQTTAGVGGSYKCEVWDGAAWVAIGTLGYSTEQLFRYGNNPFIRANSEEVNAFGIDDDTNWQTTTILGITAYWVRWRIDVVVSVAPVWERLCLEESTTRINEFGVRLGSGLGRWRGTVISAGNIWSEDGTVTNASVPIGTGGGNTGWSHDIDQATFGGVNDALYVQFTIPRGLDTSYPLNIKLIYSPDTTDAAGDDFAISLMPIEVQGVLVADPAGGINPIPRTLANTRAFDSYAAQFDIATVNFTDPNKAQRIEFGPYDVSDFYEDDLIAIRLKLDAVNPNSPDTISWGVIIEGVYWSDGKGLL